METSGGSGSTVEMVEHQNQMSMEVGIEGCDDSELELGLGLSIGVVGSKNLKQIPRILTAKDLPSSVSRPVVPPPSSASSCSSLGLRTPPANNNGSNNTAVGTKRAASPTGARYSHQFLLYFFLLGFGNITMFCCGFGVCLFAITCFDMLNSVRVEGIS